MNKDKESKGNTTKYGEEIPTKFSWISLDEQKKRAEYLASIGNSKKDNISEKKNV